MSNGLWTTSVGSFPKPPELLKARTEHAAGRLSDEDLHGLERSATERWIRFQERIRVDILVDGEQYRGDMATYFAENMEGFEIGGLVRSYGNRYYRKPIATGAVRRTAPITVEMWRYAQSLTERPVKGMLTGPYTIADWSFDEHYGSRREFVLDLAHAIHDEAMDLADAGARFIQIDEPAASARIDELPLVAEAMGIVTDGLPAYSLTHICYGDFMRAYPTMLDIPVDQIDLEMTNSDFDLLERFRDVPFTKHIGLGVVDSHDHRVESVDEVVRGIRLALDVLPPESIFVDPDCGLKTRTVEEAEAKMTAVVEAVRRVRDELGIGDKLPEGRPTPGRSVGAPVGSSAAGGEGELEPAAP
jgi:5-methyltetrahydropteroyltriglutamate--homocysteine methyltransferase